MAEVVLLALLLGPALASAIPPAVCTQRMVGTFRASDGRSMPVTFRLRMRSDEGEVSFFGRMRCTARKRRQCFIDANRASALYFEREDGGLTQHVRYFRLYRTGTSGPVCELTGSTPYLRDLCMGALGGTFTCRGEEASSVTGAFGLAVDSCEPCLFRQR